jgi:peptidoglycan/LPS O-acetylase OafA/YrhL
MPPPSAPTLSPGAPRFDALDACRGLCAVAVVLFHLNAATHGVTFWRGGYVAVMFFFVLSGFVLSQAYRSKIRDRGDLGRFAIRRFGRLYPLHAFVLGLYVLIEIAYGLHESGRFFGTTSVPALVSQIFLVQAFTPYAESWNFPAWSISVELWTSLGFGLLILIAPKRLRWVSAVLGVALFSTTLLETPLAGLTGPVEAAALVNVAQYIGAFFVGVLTWDAYQWTRTRGWRPWAGLDVLALLMGLAVVALADDLGSAAQTGLFALIVFILAFENGAASRLLKSPPLVRLGTVSFSIYLTHSLYTLAAFLLVLDLGRRLGVPATIEVDGGGTRLVLGGVWAMDALAATCLAAVVAGSMLTYRFIEEPGRAVFNRIARRGRIGALGLEPSVRREEI